MLGMSKVPGLWWRSGNPSLNHLPLLFGTFYFTILSPSFAACSLPSMLAFNPHSTPLYISLSTTLTLAFHRLSLRDWWPHHWAGSWEGVQVLLVKVIPHFPKYFIWGAGENEREGGAWRPEAYLFLTHATSSALGWTNSLLFPSLIKNQCLSSLKQAVLAKPNTITGSKRGSWRSSSWPMKGPVRGEQLGNNLQMKADVV